MKLNLFVYSKQRLIITIIFSWIFYCVLNAWADPIIIDHNNTDITQIPQADIERAKNDLHIAYGHTSHGSQLTSGMTGLVAFANGGGLGLTLPTDFFAWNNGGNNGALDLHDYAMSGDVGYYPAWVNNTRAYLDNHADVNVIIWSWCGQVDSKYSNGTLESQYIDPMNQLEIDYPNVQFIYMTGHVDIWDDADNKAANQVIRDYCNDNDKILYDFADIEHYDPDGNYYEFVHDNCDYYSGPGVGRLGNWALEWQASHTQGVDWYSCSSAHSQALNANRKAYAAWWLWARLGGWDGGEGSVCNEDGVCDSGESYPTCPNDCQDNYPPSRSAGSPNGVLPAGTTVIDISLNTNEPSTCRYSNIVNTDYDSMASDFTTDNGEVHFDTIAGLQNNTTYQYYVRCQDENGNQNDNDYIINFSVSSPPLPLADFSSNSVEVDEGESVKFNDQSENAVMWSWDFEGGTPTTSVEQNPTVTYETSGSFRVSLTAQNSEGAVDIEIKSNFIQVNKVEIPCVEEWSCSAWSGWSVCTETGQSRTRTCLDENECETEINKPVETEVKSCLLDITPPVRSKGQPIGKCPKGTTQIDITLQTDENSICRSSKNKGTSYSEMKPFYMPEHLTRNHSTTLAGLADGDVYSIYLRCADKRGNENRDDYRIKFFVDAGSKNATILELYMQGILPATRD